MSVGVVMLVHTALNRAEQVARHWVQGGCPVVIHVDASVAASDFAAFKANLGDLDQISFSKRKRCEWGTWGIVQATQLASRQLLDTHQQVRHVYLASGSCLPLRPISELVSYLEDRPNTDFIESATTQDVPWTVGGLSAERFTLRFPFSWKNQRYLFDRYVWVQRKLRLKRPIPKGLIPHMGSQWWCLTRQTLSAILEDPERGTYDRFFKRVWIPDESYFQTLARIYSRKIESRSLTLSKFDFQGKPHIFYDDHLQLLRRSDCFVARKIWPFADKLYETFLNAPEDPNLRAEPAPAKIDRIFAKAVERRTRGRKGLYMQGRFPFDGADGSITSSPYSVFSGFTELFEDFEDWLQRATNVRAHGHLFGPDRVEFANGETAFTGALSDSAIVRDYAPKDFLTSLIWNTRGERQCFQYGPADTQDLNWKLALDPNAQISVISGAWALPLFASNRNFSEIRKEAAEFQKIESKYLEVFKCQWAKARVRIWTLAEFIEAPMEPLQAIIDEMGQKPSRRLTEVPRMVDMTGFGQFLQNLKNQGMHPYLMGDFPVTDVEPPSSVKSRKPYLVK
ncbi:beta-1,6-N-acetylglucosaminyltransferase [Nereida sp. MMG025]|uniref:beta-1,6-N-acetylglucosaminyltransferase n=1 Tax=Nereida sp. MMG025 TaxID=2909981 RepID=UPI001F2DCD1F|nr:beta-1,6-N-acetylglucosaminyltransferase [Nereida sp. MMG025]MCF6444554.1 beta-1,6-N-acetylglucosaminyltransferase [Nereida sp. MMG025]